MKYWIYNKCYVSTDELAKIFSRDYKMKITQGDIQRICHHYNVPFLKKDGLTLFSSTSISAMRTQNDDFMTILMNICHFGTARGIKKFTDEKKPSWENEPLPTYHSEEEDMDYCNNELLKKYQFEGRKIIKITESQHRRLFTEAIKHKRFVLDYSKQNLQESNVSNILYRRFNDTFRQMARHEMYLDKKRYKEQMRNARMNGSDGSNVRPVINFFMPHVYVSYVLGHPKLITIPPTFRNSYYFKNIKFQYQGKVYTGDLRVSNHELSYDTALDSAAINDGNFGFKNDEGRQIDFTLSLVFPTPTNFTPSNEEKENGIRTVYCDEYLFNQNLTDDFLEKVGTDVRRFIDGMVYKFGNTSLFGMQPRTFATDGSNPMPQESNITIQNIGLANIQPKKRKPYNTKKRREALEAQKQAELDKVNNIDHVIDVMRIKKGFLGINYNGTDLQREDFKMLERPIKNVINDAEVTIVQGKKIPNEQMIGHIVKLPFPIVDGKPFPSGKYYFKANGLLVYTMEITRTEENRLKIGDLSLVSKTYKPMC